MPLPKYLRPIRDPQTYNLTKMEKIVRMAVFAPLLIIFSAPTAIAVGAIALLGYWVIAFFISGAGNLAANPSQYGFQAFALVAILGLLVISNGLARAIRRYFLPFG